MCTTTIIHTLSLFTNIRLTFYVYYLSAEHELVLISACSVKN